MTVLPSNPFDSFAPSTLSYNYYWTQAQGASWGQYLRSRDVVDAINGGSAAASAHLARCMSQNCQALIGSVSSLESNLSSSIGSLESTVEDSISSLKWTLVDSIDAMGHQIAYAFTWGFSSLLAYLGSMRATAEDLLRVARTPAQTAAFEQFEVAREAFRKKLYSECLEAIGRAIDGVPGVSAGFKLEWRFYHLRGLVLLGSHDHADAKTTNVSKAEEAFLLSARYAKHDFPADAAKAMLAAGWAAYIQARKKPPLLRRAIQHTNEALELDSSLGEALFQMAKFMTASGMPQEAFPFLRKASESSGIYLAKASADGNFKVHAELMENFLADLREEKLGRVRSATAEIASTIKPLLPRSAEMAQHPLVMRILAFADKTSSNDLLQLCEYLNKGFEQDKQMLKDTVFDIVTIVVPETKEEVAENISTGEVERYEETEMKECEEEVVVKPKTWLWNEVREKRIVLRPVRVVKERPVTRTIRKTVVRRGAEERHVQIVNGLGDVLLAGSSSSICARTFRNYQLLRKAMEALVNVVRTNPVVSLRPGNEPLRFVTACHLAQHKRQNQDVEFPADWGIGIDVPGSPQEPAYSIRWRLQFCYYYHEVEESMYFLEYGEETWRGEARLTTDRYWKVLISLHNPEGAKNLWNCVQDITNSSDFDSVHNDIISLKEAGLGVDWKLGREAARAMALLVAQ